MSSTRRSDLPSRALRPRLARAARAALVAAILLPAAASAEAPRDRAIRAAKQATTLYKAGQHAEAAELFLEAHQLTGLSVQLRNAAKALEESGATARAIEAWRKLQALPAATDEERAEAREHLARLEPPVVVAPPPPAPFADPAPAEPSAAPTAGDVAADPTPSIDAAPAADPTSAALLETSPPPAKEVNWPAYGLIGGGTASLTGGVILMLASTTALGILDDSLGNTEDGLITGIDIADAQRDLDAINTQRAISGALLGVGAAAIVAGALWAAGVLGGS